MKKCHRVYPLLMVLLAMISCQKKEKGCTDPKASNYDITADEDDGSCVIIDYMEGNYLLYGTKSTVLSSGQNRNVLDTLSINSLGSPRYRITGMDACGEVVIEVTQNSWSLISSTCGLNNWQSQFFGEDFNSLSFYVVEQDTNWRYNCQLYKL